MFIATPPAAPAARRRICTATIASRSAPGAPIPSRLRPPGGAAEILVTQASKPAFQQYRYGYAAAYSTVIFLILLVYGVFQNRVTRATEGI